MTSRWRVAALGGVAAVVALLLGASLPLLPLVRTDWALDNLVRAVALDWRDFGRRRAEERLQLEIAEQGLDRWVGAEACAWTDGEQRVIHCTWGTHLAVPLVRRRVPLDFESRAVVTAEGDLQ